MQEIPLIAISRQSLSVVLAGNRWGVRVYEVGAGVMAADISLNDQPLINGIRCAPGVPLLPYDYMQRAAGGNFAFATLGDVLPWWRDFGTPVCRLLWADAAELTI